MEWDRHNFECFRQTTDERNSTWRWIRTVSIADRLWWERKNYGVLCSAAIKTLRGKTRTRILCCPCRSPTAIVLCGSFQYPRYVFRISNTTAFLIRRFCNDSAETFYLEFLKNFSSFITRQILDKAKPCVPIHRHELSRSRWMWRKIQRPRKPFSQHTFESWASHAYNCLPTVEMLTPPTHIYDRG